MAEARKPSTFKLPLYPHDPNTKPDNVNCEILFDEESVEDQDELDLDSESLESCDEEFINEWDEYENGEWERDLEAIDMDINLDVKLDDEKSCDQPSTVKPASPVSLKLRRPSHLESRGNTRSISGPCLRPKTSNDNLGDPKEKMHKLWELDFYTELSTNELEQIEYSVKKDQTTVLNASPNRLIAHVLMEINERIENGIEWEEAVQYRSFAHVIMVTFIWFTTPKDLLLKLLSIYSTPPLEEISNFIPHMAVRKAICAMIMNWMRCRPEDFDSNSQLQRICGDFMTKNTIGGTHETDRSVLPSDLQKLNSYRISGHYLPTKSNGKGDSITADIPIPEYEKEKEDTNENESDSNSGSSEKVEEECQSQKCLDLLDNQLKILAKQIVHFDHKMFAAIKLEEFLSRAWTRPRCAESVLKAPNIYSSINLFNNVTLWVTSTILKGETATARAHILTRFIKLAQKLLDNKSFNFLMAVHSSINHITIQRLKLTLDKLDKKTNDMLNSLNDILTPDSNYIAYRDKISAVSHDEHCIPYLGVILRDLTFLDDAHATINADGRINCLKLQILGDIFCPMRQWQLLPPPYEYLTDMCELIRVMLRPQQTADELYKISQEREVKKKLTEGSDRYKDWKQKSSYMKGHLKEPNTSPIILNSPSYSDLYGSDLPN
eukprot:Ihof_evm1s971 gene=Ihof_evmTU1s971